jgi:hypothetical protein
MVERLRTSMWEDASEKLMMSSIFPVRLSKPYTGKSILATLFRLALEYKILSTGMACLVTQVKDSHKKQYYNLLQI